MRFCTTTLPALFAALVLPATFSTTACGDDGPAGVARISDTRRTVYRFQSPDAVVGNGMCRCGFPNCPGPSGWGHSNAWSSPAGWNGGDGNWQHGFRRNDLKVGNGTYDITYAVTPCYYDRRDARVYSAYGYGVPIAVPLAPNVHFAYNHGWGVPSSRLTPISRPGYPCP